MYFYPIHRLERAQQSRAWADCVNAALEQNGHTERGNINLKIEISYQNLRQLKSRIGKLQNWLKEEQSSAAPTTLADYIQDIHKRKAQDMDR